MRVAIIVAIFIGVLSFIALAVLGVIAPAGTGTDWVISIVGGIFMGAVAYFIIDQASQRKRILASVLFGLVIVAVLVLGFQSQVLAALLTGLIGAAITYIIYPIVVGTRTLFIKFLTIAIAAVILIAAFAVLDPIKTVYAGSILMDNTANPGLCLVQQTNPGSLLPVNVTAGDSIEFRVNYNINVQNGPLGNIGPLAIAYDSIGMTVTQTTQTGPNTYSSTVLGGDGKIFYANVAGTGYLKFLAPYPTVGTYTVRVDITGQYLYSIAPGTPFGVSQTCTGNSKYLVTVAPLPTSGGSGGGGRCTTCRT